MAPNKMRDKPVTAQQLFRLIEVEIVDLEQDIARLRKKIAEDSGQRSDGGNEDATDDLTAETAEEQRPLKDNRTKPVKPNFFQEQQRLQPIRAKNQLNLAT